MQNNKFYDEFPSYNNIENIKDFPPKVTWSDPNTKDRVTIQKKSPDEDYWFVSVKSDTPVSYELSSEGKEWKVHNVVGMEGEEKSVASIVEYTAMTASCGDSTFSDKFHAGYEKSALKSAKERYEEEERKERTRKRTM